MQNWVSQRRQNWKTTQDEEQAFAANTSRGVIGEVWCGFLWIYTPTLYSAVFLLYALVPAPMKIGFSAVRCDAVWCDAV